MTPIYAQLAGGTSGDWLGPFLLIYGVIWLLTLAFVLGREDYDPVTKLTWVIVLIFVPFFGILLYWAIAPGARTQVVDRSKQVSGTPWENDSGHTGKAKQG